VPELSDDIRDDILYKRTAHPIRVLGRLKEGISRTAAQQELDALARNIAEQQPKTNANLGAVIIPMQGFEMGNLAGPLFGFAILSLLVLIVSISNVTNLQLARLRGRLAELALRTCLGATRQHLLVHQLGEAVALGLCVALTGLPIAALLLRAAAVLNPIKKVDTSVWSLDAKTALFVVAAAFAGSLLAALLPFVLARHIDPARGLSGAAGRSLTQRSDNLRRAVLVCQAVLAVVVASVAADLARSYAAANHADSGINTDGVAVARITLPMWKVPPRGKDQYPQWPALVPVYERIQTTLEATPGLTSVALAQNHPQVGNWRYAVEIDGATAASGAPETWHIQPTGPLFLDMLGVRLLQGREIASTDVAGAAPVVLINHTAAERYFPGENPLGKRLRLLPKDAWREVVGVVADMHVSGPNVPVQPTVIPVLEQTPIGNLVVIAKGRSSAAALLPILRDAILKAEPDATVEEAEPLADASARLLAPQRFAVWMCSLPAFWILLLTLAGLIGVVALDVTQRRTDVAIHVALGATRGRVLLLVLQRTLTWFGTGIVLGLVAVHWVAAPLGRSLDLALSPSPLFSAAVAAVLLLVALFASLVPARSALRSSTMQVLQRV
jgi:putative ABC transport system permease protein